MQVPEKFLEFWFLQQNTAIWTDRKNMIDQIQISRGWWLFFFFCEKKNPIWWLFWMQQFAQRMTVEALPTFLLLTQGYTVLARVVGVDKEELRSSIMQEHRDKAAAGAGLEKVNPEQDIDEPLSLFSSPYAFLRARLRSFFN